MSCWTRSRPLTWPRKHGPVKNAHNTTPYTITWSWTLGGVTSYFDHPEWAAFAPGLKSLEDALRIRREVLLAFERAENEHRAGRAPTPDDRGGRGGSGPTGVELAGAFAEIVPA